MAAFPAPASVLVYSGLELIGDGVMKLAFLRTLRAAFPQARLTWLAGKGRTVFAHELAPLVANLLDEVIEDAGIGDSLRELLGPPPLGRRSFDLVIDTQSRVLTSLIVKRIRHHRFISPAMSFLLSDGRPSEARKRRHLHDRLVQLIALATGEPAPPPLAARVPEAERNAALRLLPEGARYVGFLPGAGDRAKCWPLERFIALARAQAAKDRRAVFVLGPSEQEWHAPLESAVPDALFPLREAAALDIDIGPLLTIALAIRLAAAVANDSGGGHLIAAGGAPMVSLFGPSDPAKFHPAAERLEILTAQQFGGSTMDAIPLEAVTRALDRILED